MKSCKTISFECSFAFSWISFIGLLRWIWRNWLIWWRFWRNVIRIHVVLRLWRILVWLNNKKQMEIMCNSKLVIFKIKHFCYFLKKIVKNIVFWKILDIFHLTYTKIYLRFCFLKKFLFSQTRDFFHCILKHFLPKFF